MPAEQILLPDHELKRLLTRVEDDYRNAVDDHDTRLKRHMRSYRNWRNRALPNDGEDPDAPNFRVPLTKWHVKQALSKQTEMLFGDDAEVLAVPRGPVDAPIARKAARYLHYRVLDYMRLPKKLSVFNFRRILFGRAHAYCPWEKRAFAGRDGRPLVDYDGVAWHNLWPDDIILPGEDAECIHDFSWVIRKSVFSLDDLLRGESAGVYQNVRKNLELLLKRSEHGSPREHSNLGDPVKDEAELGEGVVRREAESSRDSVPIYHWYGHWRPLKGRKEADENDFRKRREEPQHLLVKYQPDLGLILGVQDLTEIYPDTPRPRPFVEAALIQDGSYWSPGFGEILEEVEEEMTALHNLGVQGGEFSVGPLVFYRPAKGFRPEKIELRPNTGIPVENPQTDVNVVSLSPNLEYPVVYGQELRSIAERVTHQTDLALGRQSDRPNAPRTVGQTALLLEAGDVGVAYDLRMLREDLKEALGYVWRMERSFSTEETFFRVTEEEAGGLFATQAGGAMMRASDFSDSLDFDFRFATSAVSREVQRERSLELYGLDLQNPLIATNPRALWKITEKLHRSFGDHEFSRLVPEPPDMEPTVPPEHEHALLNQGEEIAVRPGDNDQLHLIEHERRMRRLQERPDANPEELARLAAHYRDHIGQLQQKRLMEALAQRVANSLSTLMDAGLGGQPNETQTSQGHSPGAVQNGGGPAPGGNGGRPQQARPQGPANPAGPLNG